MQSKRIEFENNEIVVPKVSIIVPVYNAGYRLRPCMDTLVSQTLRDIEIICVLDCPTDGSDKVIEEYAAKDNRIVVIRNEQNLHIGHSRNKGLSVARGEYIGFSDHDDTRDFDMYERLYEKAVLNNYDVVFSGSLGKRIIEENISPLDLYKGHVARRLSPLIMPNMYRRNFLQNNNIQFFDTKICTLEDVLFMAQICQCFLNNEYSYTSDSRFYYQHIFHESNEVNTGDYWGLTKTSNTIHQLKEITLHSQCQVDEELAEMVLRSLYTSLRFERKHNCSLFQFLKRMQTPVIVDILKTQPIKYNTRLTLVKNLFALLIISTIRLTHRSKKNNRQ